MIIKETKYVIATKEFPLEFEDKSGEYNTNKMQEAMFYDDKVNAEQQLNNNYDNPEEFIILPVVITYEI